MGESAIALFVSKDKIYAFNESIKEIFRSSSNKTAFELISMLNPKIRGFFNYFNLGSSSRYLDFVRQALYQNC
jgi:hypothetical protein